MNKFHNSKIYRIVNDVNGMTYYGSTTQTLSRRMTNHRTRCKNKIYKTYQLFGNIEDCKIFLIENFPCENKEQLEKRERHYIENNECINKYIPSRSRKEWYVDNKTAIIKKQRQYRLENKPIIVEKNKQYKLDNIEKLRKKCNCECGGKFTHQNKSQHYKSKKHLKYLENKSKP